MFLAPANSIHTHHSLPSHDMSTKHILKRIVRYHIFSEYFLYRYVPNIIWDISFPGGSDGKASACCVGDPGSIPGLGRSSGEGNGNPLQYSCLENPMDQGAWWAMVHRVSKSRTQLTRLSTAHTNTNSFSELVLEV